MLRPFGDLDTPLDVDGMSALRLELTLQTQGRTGVGPESGSLYSILIWLSMQLTALGNFEHPRRVGHGRAR